MGALVPASTAGMAAPDVARRPLRPPAHRAGLRRGQEPRLAAAPARPLRGGAGGHLPPALCATALLCRPRPGIPAGASSMPQALAAARNQKCKACDDKAVTCEPTSAANELHRAIGAKCPVEVPFVCGKN